jgi:hypothetical protein
MCFFLRKVGLGQYVIHAQCGPLPSGRPWFGRSLCGPQAHGEWLVATMLLHAVPYSTSLTVSVFTMVI